MPDLSKEATPAENFQPLFLWSPKKILSFIICIRKKLDHLEKSNPTFWNNINQAAQKLGVMRFNDESGQWNWEQAFKEKQLNVLTSSYNKQSSPTDYEFYPVTDLVAAFCHGYKRQNEISNADKELLFGKKIITPHVYVSFWIRKLPELLPFLWNTFIEVVDDDLKSFYPLSLPLHKEINNSHMSWLLENFKAALAKIKSRGFLKGRYALNDKILEFYQLSPDLLPSIVTTGIPATTLRISGNHVTVYSTAAENGLTHIGETICPNRTFFFAYKVVRDQVHQNVIADLSNRILYFASDLSNISEILQAASNRLKSVVREVPLTFGDFEDKLLVKVLNRKVFVWKEKEVSELWRWLNPSEIEDSIKGEDLNRLLQRCEFWMFRKVSLPKVDRSVYIPRHFSYVEKNGDIMVVPEAGFCEVLNDYDPWQIIYIVGECGLQTSKTVESIGTRNLPRNLKICDIIRIFQTILCETDIERNLISHWLRSQTSVQRIRLEIIFDGLHEIPAVFLERFYQILYLIRQNCPCVRQWITNTDCMIQEFTRRFDFIRFELVPLTLEESHRLHQKYLTLLPFKCT